ncbi:MAG: galactokinase [Clostridiales bacterium]|nr:galactokinase [Clostridiales bacterium]
MKEKCIEAFKRVFNKSGDICCFAPGRVNLIGEHTDYNGGYVLPCAVTQGVVCVASKRNDRLFRLYSLNLERRGITEISLDSIKKTRSWADYPAGVINTFLRFGYKLDCGADILYYGNVPRGAGLSSSAAMETATAVILRVMFSLPIPDNLLAIIGQFAENHFVGVNCGIMDQFAVAMGKKDYAVLLNSKTLEYKYINIPTDKTDIIIVNSLVRRGLANSKYNERRRECEKAFAMLSAKTGASSLCDVTVEQFERYKDELHPKLLCRARHVIYENDRVLKAAQALKSNDIENFGILMNESHKSLKNDYEVSCAQLDFLADAAQKFPGVFGSRMTGAGFGGCTVNLVSKEKSDAFADYIKKEYFAAFKTEPHVYKTLPGDGAKVLFKF